MIYRTVGFGPKVFRASPVTYRDHRDHRKWSRGSTGRGHQPQEVAWAKRGRATSPKWAGAPPTKRPKAQEVETGGNPRRWWA